MVRVSGRPSSSASSILATNPAKIRWYSDSGGGKTFSWKRRGVRGLVRDDGVGVETAKGSLKVESDDEVRVEMERETAKEFELDEEGRSSSDGGAMPNSVYSQSIWTSVADSWWSRFACQS